MLRQSLGFPSSITGTFLYAAGMPKRGVVGLVADADSDAVEGEGEGEGEEGAAAAGEGGGGEPDREQAGKLKEVAEAEGERHREGDLANPEEGDQKGATDPEDGVEGGGGGVKEQEEMADANADADADADADAGGLGGNSPAVLRPSGQGDAPEILDSDSKPDPDPMEIGGGAHPSVVTIESTGGFSSPSSPSAHESLSARPGILTVTVVSSAAAVLLLGFFAVRRTRRKSRGRDGNDYSPSAAAAAKSKPGAGSDLGSTDDDGSEDGFAEDMECVGEIFFHGDGEGGRRAEGGEGEVSAPASPPSSFLPQSLADAATTTLAAVRSSGLSLGAREEQSADGLTGTLPPPSTLSRSPDFNKRASIAISASETPAPTRTRVEDIIASLERRSGAENTLAGPIPTTRAGTLAAGTLAVVAANDDESDDSDESDLEDEDTEDDRRSERSEATGSSDVTGRSAISLATSATPLSLDQADAAALQGNRFVGLTLMKDQLVHAGAFDTITGEPDVGTHQTPVPTISCYTIGRQERSSYLHSNCLTADGVFNDNAAVIPSSESESGFAVAPEQDPITVEQKVAVSSEAPATLQATPAVSTMTRNASHEISADLDAPSFGPDSLGKLVDFEAPNFEPDSHWDCADVDIASTDSDLSSTLDPFVTPEHMKMNDEDHLIFVSSTAVGSSSGGGAYQMERIDASLNDYKHEDTISTASLLHDSVASESGLVELSCHDDNGPIPQEMPAWGDDIVL